MKHYITPVLFILSFLSFGQKVENRAQILNYLKSKINQGEPLVAHVLVPLCDNEHQGIVPTSASLGIGMDPDHNLY